MVANLFQLTKDARGRWRRQNLGLKKGEDGQVGSATFFLGTDYEEACKRVVLLERMWDTVRENWQEDSPPFWRPTIYQIALTVARGEKDLDINAPTWADSPESQVASALGTVHGPPFVCRNRGNVS